MNRSWRENMVGKEERGERCTDGGAGSRLGHRWCSRSPVANGVICHSVVKLSVILLRFRNFSVCPTLQRTLFCYLFSSLLCC